MESNSTPAGDTLQHRQDIGFLKGRLDQPSPYLEDQVSDKVLCSPRKIGFRFVRSHFDEHCIFFRWVGLVKKPTNQFRHIDYLKDQLAFWDAEYQKILDSRRRPQLDGKKRSNKFGDGTGSDGQCMIGFYSVNTIKRRDW